MINDSLFCASFLICVDKYDRFAKDNQHKLLRTFNDHCREVRAIVDGTLRNSESETLSPSDFNKLVKKCEKHIKHNEYSMARHTVEMLCVSRGHNKYSVYKRLVKAILNINVNN